jgi:Raf kinase inhibitor-like YbhB/YbcL family protein
VHTVELLEQAMDAAQRCGYKIRQEWFGGGGGGDCMLGGNKILFLDLAASPSEQLDQILHTLKREPDARNLPMPQCLRKLLTLLAVCAFLSAVGTACSKGADQMNKIQLSSSAFQPGQLIPKKFTGEGDDVSPAVSWKGLPDGTKQLALICDDPDAPGKDPWVHWVIYGIAPNVTSLPEAVLQDERPAAPAGAVQGKNSWPDGENIGYRGPMPPKGHGTHHYHFRLYALDVALSLEPGLDKYELLEKLKGHVLGEGEIIGTYERR